MAKKCIICENEFKPKRSSLERWCSYECYVSFLKLNPRNYSKKSTEIKPEPFKPIRKRSLKRAKQEMVYTLKRKKYMDEHKICERCFNEPSEVCHHKKGRIGDLLTDERYFMALSDKCHQHIHDYPTEAYANGWMLNRNI